MAEDPRLAEAQGIPIGEIADRLEIDGLVRVGAERTGPCPSCGGRDRFSINVQRGVWNCRHGCMDGLGADGIGLVRLVKGCDFRAALDWLVGRRAVDLNPAEAERRRRRAEEAARAREREANRHRQRAIDRARGIWNECRPAEGSPVIDYLQARGIRIEWLPSVPPALRFHPALPYMVQGGRPGEWIERHRGPCMVAAVTDGQNRVTGVHRTWIDPSRPKGKALILKDGAPQDVKKVWGHKKGCAIRLGGQGRRLCLVMGEGIETTLSARVAIGARDTHFWAGVDLGNMGGRRDLRGKGKKYAGLPDLADDEAFLPPPGVEELVFVQDGDSDPRLTRAKLLSGLRRARACVPSVARIRIVHAGEGRDLNDILMEDPADV